MDLVHDSRDNSGSRKSTVHWDSQTAPTGARGGPTVDVPLARSASFPSCTKEESLVVRWAGTTTLCPPLIIKKASAARTSPRLAPIAPEAIAISPL